jgi:hypothetical protein
MNMNTYREIAYRIDPALWMREVLGMAPRPWQAQFLRVPRGASMLALTARQIGKTTTAAVGISHSAVFLPGSLSVVACPTELFARSPFSSLNRRRCCGPGCSRSRGRFFRPGVRIARRYVSKAMADFKARGGEPNVN